MKFSLSALASALFIGAASAQYVLINAPTNGSTVMAGSDIVVQVYRPNFQSSAVEMGIALGIIECFGGQCSSGWLGNLLYMGSYNPQYHPDPYPAQFYQNYTVTIPEFLSGTLSQLSVFHVSLVGASLGPFTETKAITLNVV